MSIKFDNDIVRVTKFNLEPGQETGFHRHNFNYVIVPIVDGELTISSKDNPTFKSFIKAGDPYFRNAGVEHNVTNKSDKKIIFIEIEIKDSKNINSN